MLELKQKLRLQLLSACFALMFMTSALPMQSRELWSQPRCIESPTWLGGLRPSVCALKIESASLTLDVALLGDQKSSDYSYFFAVLLRTADIKVNELLVKSISLKSVGFVTGVAIVNEVLQEFYRENTNASKVELRLVGSDVFSEYLFDRSVMNIPLGILTNDGRVGLATELKWETISGSFSPGLIAKSELKFVNFKQGRYVETIEPWKNVKSIILVRQLR
jgi:hypothetical protein